MNWKVKALIQKFICCFPSGLSYELYFKMQRYSGAYKKPFNPLYHFAVAVDILKKIQKYRLEIKGKYFFEVGTGRLPLLPVAFWLCGAGKTITIDLNSYIRNELIMDMFYFFTISAEEIKNVFGDLLQNDRFEQLLEYSRSERSNQKEFLRICEIEYIAPGDASKTNLDNNSIDYHISHTVYEHIPLDILINILQEGNRIIKHKGIFINCIDYSDHFSYMDNNISAVNFLQYDDKSWEKYAGNRYMYMNRARHDEFIELFKMAGHDFIEIEPYINKNVLDLLEKRQIKLDDKFKSKSNDILSITSSWFITKNRLYDKY